MHTLQSILVRVALWGVPSGVYLWTQYGRDALRPMRLGLPPTAMHWAQGIGISVLASVAVSLAVARKLDVPPVVVWSMVPQSLFRGFPAGELFEELTFRGVVLSQMLAVLGVGDFDWGTDQRRRLKFWLANFTASAVFVGLHWPWWIYTHGFVADFWTKSAGVFLISLVLGAVFVRGRSLWPCVALHWMNNALSSLAP